MKLPLNKGEWFFAGGGINFIHPELVVNIDYFAQAVLSVTVLVKESAVDNPQHYRNSNVIDKVEIVKWTRYKVVRTIQFEEERRLFRRPILHKHRVVQATIHNFNSQHVIYKKWYEQKDSKPRTLSHLNERWGDPKWTYFGRFTAKDKKALLYLLNQLITSRKDRFPKFYIDSWKLVIEMVKRLLVY